MQLTGPQLFPYHDSRVQKWRKIWDAPSAMVQGEHSYDPFPIELIGNLNYSVFEKRFKAFRKKDGNFFKLAPASARITSKWILKGPQQGQYIEGSSFRSCGDPNMRHCRTNIFHGSDLLFVPDKKYHISKT
ncbi:hypothetical protein GRJ2_001568600 [Grus japonensis]|uniref:Uncharacterized protein n=1 Tax=Grus japonensis TaxID=30415 RepID=A0ABC9X015_GRUJA